MKFKLCPEIHPVLFSVAPALLLVSNNLGQAFLSDAIAPIGITLLGVLLLWIFLSFFLKDRKKVGIMISVFLLIFFSFGHIHDLLRYQFASPFLGELMRPRYLLLFCVSLIALASYLIIKTHKNLDQCTAFMNYMSLALVIISLAQVGGYFLQENSSRNKFNETRYKAVVTDESKNQKVFPDIYYIILDAYANESTLKEYLKYDNRYFIDYLRGKGFYVASKSRSNYASTVVSLPSSLNMEYINYLTEIAGRESTDRYYAYQMMGDNKVMRFLKSKGYKIINFNSTMHPTRKLKIADLNVHCTHTKEFNSIYIQTTMYYAFEKYFHWVEDKRKHILCTFSKIAEYSKMSGPKLIFAHMLIPHNPYVFGPNGEPVQKYEGQDPEVKNLRYLGQLTFANKKVRELIEQILPKSPPFPIIILQSDHGPELTSHPHKVFVREKLKNFNAYYLPGKGGELLYDSISPVNTFRLIFGHYFNAKFDLLKDHSYYSGLNIYDFNEVIQDENIGFHSELKQN